MNQSEPCRQCNKRAIGRHSVNVVQTRAQRRRLKQRPVSDVPPESVETDSLPNGGTIFGPAVSGGPPVGIAGGGGSVLQGGTLGDPRDETVCGTNHGGTRFGPARDGGTKYRDRTDFGNSSNFVRPMRRGRRRSAPSIRVTAPTAFEAGIGEWSPMVIREAQLRDPDIAPAIKWTEEGIRPPWTEVQGRSPMLRALWQQFESLSIKSGVLCRSFYDDHGMVQQYQLVLPCEMKVAFLELIHADAAGHLKFAKCVPHVIRRAWWYSWRRDLNLFIRCCAKCEGYHRGPPPRQANLNPMLIGGPGERWALDLQGPFPPSNGYKYLFTAICPFSKFGVCVPLRNKEASTVARALVDHVFLKWGLCFTILTDQGLEFEAELLKELCNILGVTRVRTSAYRPQGNGGCEVWHRTINTMLAKVISTGQRDWSEWVPYITFCYNATVHSASGFAPFFVFTGRQPLWTADLFVPEAEGPGKTVPAYTAETVDRLNRAMHLVREHLQTSASSASRWYNRRARPREFAEGDLVRVYYPRKFVGRTPKWLSFYATEGEIVRKLNDASYLVKSRAWKGQKVIHTDKLKPILTFNS